MLHRAYPENGVMPRILRMMMLRAVVCVLVLAAAATHAAAHSELGADAQAFVRDMVERHGFERSALERALRNTKFLASIVRAMDAPSTALPWHEFRARHITEARINAGLRFWTENAAVLERAAVEYQVPPEIMVATIGIEPWFVPVLAILLLIGLWGFFQTSQQHGKWQWFCLAAAASTMVLGGRLAELPFLVWSGGFVLVVVYLFDLGAKRKWRQNL